MSRRSDRGGLTDMRDAAREAIRTFSEATADALDHDRNLNLALLHLLQVVGEAATRVSSHTREACPEIPWKTIIGMRNRIVHAYDQVVKEIVHDTVASDLPSLADQLDAILGED